MVCLSGVHHSWGVQLYTQEPGCKQHHIPKSLDEKLTSVRTARLSESSHFTGFGAQAAPDTATSSGRFDRSRFNSAYTTSPFNCLDHISIVSSLKSVQHGRLSCAKGTRIPERVSIILADAT